MAWVDEFANNYGKALRFLHRQIKKTDSSGRQARLERQRKMAMDNATKGKTYGSSDNAVPKMSYGGAVRPVRPLPVRGGKMKLAVVKDKVAEMKNGGKVKSAVVKDKVAEMKKGGQVKGLTAKQKAKLPKALQDAILKKRGLK